MAKSTTSIGYFINLSPFPQSTTIHHGALGGTPAQVGDQEREAPEVSILYQVMIDIWPANPPAEPLGRIHYTLFDLLNHNCNLFQYESVNLYIP